MRRCLICKEIKIEAYGICYDCKAKNIEMSNQHVDLTGYTALVTGARIRIGYATCLRLLRDGATVIGITRFPYDAYIRYSKEADFENFKDQLFLYGFDFRRVDRLQELISFLYQEFESIDIIINNAAQTIKKSRAYYANLIEEEKQARYLVEQKMNVEEIKALPLYRVEGETKEDKQWLCTLEEHYLTKYEESPNYNSWVAKVDELSVEEMLEVQLINVTTPMLLVARLKELMKKSPHKNKFIINVSSVEGRFNKKKKLSRHVHTNMAKASLNMMTHSLAAEYAKDRIFMFAVDPGWVSNQFPEAYESAKNFVPYLSFLDGATRLTHPIYTFLNDDQVKTTGALYKDFKIQEY